MGISPLAINPRLYDLGWGNVNKVVAEESSPTQIKTGERTIGILTKLDLMNVKMESKVTTRLRKNGLSTSKNPPIKIIIKD